MPFAAIDASSFLRASAAINATRAAAACGACLLDLPRISKDFTRSSNNSSGFAQRFHRWHGLQFIPAHSVSTNQRTIHTPHSAFPLPRS